MRSSLLLSVLPLAATATAHDANIGDADTSVWDHLPTVSARAGLSHAPNRPTKRQEGWSPPSELVTPLREVWDHQLETYSGGLYGFTNYGWDQIMATGG